MFERKSALESPGRTRENSIKMDLREAACKDVDYINLVQDRIQKRTSLNTVMKLHVPWNFSIRNEI